MSDLQCPATIVLLTEETAGQSELRELRLSRVLFDADSGARSRAAARRLADVHQCEHEPVSVCDGSALAAQIAELSDLYRGESVALVVPEQAIYAVLGQQTTVVEPIILAADSSGFRLVRS